MARRARYVGPIMLLLMATVLVLLFTSAVKFRANLDATQAATSDNRVWTTSQLEVDYKNLLLALYDAQKGARGVADDRLAVAFDIFYSRVDAISSTLNADELPLSLRNCLEKTLNSRDALAVQFDRLDAADPASLDGFTAEVESLAPLYRQITLESLNYYIDDASQSRESEHKLWQRFLTISVVLIGLMATAICFAVLLGRQLAQQIELVQISQRNIRLVYDASMMTVVATDIDGKIVLYNAAAEKLFGWDSGEMLGRNIADTMIPPHRLDGLHRAMRRLQGKGADAILDGKPRLSTTLDAKHREFPIELSLHANRDANGEVLLIAFIRDVSEQLAHEKDLRDARDEARRQAESRTLFLATMSHEMRTPLHGLLASLDLIDEVGQSPQTCMLLATARDCALRSVAQINDVLDLIQIDGSEEPLTAFAPVEAVSRIVSELTAVAQERGNVTQIRLTGLSQVQKWRGCPKIFARVLYNLIGNALKFTENGTVLIEMECKHDVINGHRLLVAVEDTGVGIPQEDQAHIFEMFFTSPRFGKGRRQDGTGLGLSIAQKGVEKMGGQLNLHSTLGKGSRFYFEIPAVASTLSDIVEYSQPLSWQSQNFNLSCLVVDDNIVNLELTAQMLRKLGCKVQICENGAAAVSAAKQTQYDVIFMDLNMPGGMSGGEAARNIRNLGNIVPKSPATICIVALTADVTFGSPKSLAEQSMDFVLHKPVSTSDLVRFLATFKSYRALPVDPDSPDKDTVDFADLNNLMGPVAAKRLLVGVVSDLRSVQNSMKNGTDEQRQDLLHRAIGSAGMVGLAGLSRILSGAMINLREEGDQRAELSTVYDACDQAITVIRPLVS